MDVSVISAAVAERWGVDPAGAVVVSDAASTVIRLPVADVAVHVARREATDARIVALQTARARLDEAGIPTVGLVPAPDGETWARLGSRVVEVERWVDHDGSMNTWPSLAKGAALLAQVHDAWADLDLGAAGEACTWANAIDPADVAAGLAVALPRLESWGDDALAADVRRLADLTAGDPAVPAQIVHGDFWDDNVYLRGGRIVAVTDFDFLGRRPRIDDLALTLHFADEQPAFEGITHRPAATRRAELAALVAAYACASERPFTDAELDALPHALARQPLWRYAKWLPLDPDSDRARRDALDTAPAVCRALEVMAEPDVWRDAFAAAAG